MKEFVLSQFKDIAIRLDEKRFDKFVQLRSETHAQMQLELEERKRTNPVPTETEISLGTFIEAIEPQVRDALLELNRKGYSTSSSGFGGKAGEIQIIEGMYTLDEETKKQLKKINVEVAEHSFFKHHRYTRMRFYPKDPNLDTIKDQWSKIIALIPDKGQPAQPSTADGSILFRKRYAPQSPYNEKWQEEVLSPDRNVQGRIP